MIIEEIPTNKLVRLPPSLLQIDLFLRSRLIKAAIVIAFAVGIFLSLQLWINSGRFFPTLTPHEAIPTLSSPADIILLLLFIVLCAVWIFYEKRIVGWIAIGSLFVIIIQDQMRWQPWVYLYLLMLLPYLIQSNRGENVKSILIYLQLTIAGIYIWSGIHKFNSGFLDGTFAEMINALGIGAELQTWKKVGYIIPVLECLMGAALLTHKFRRIGMYIAIITHIIILFYLSPIALNHNSVVYPWNIAMIVFVILIYGGADNNLSMTIREIPSGFLVLIPIVLVWILPFLNFFGYWDHYLSFSLYSNKVPHFYIAIEKSQIHKIDKRFENYFAEIPGLQGGQLIVVDKWAFSELNVPFYPEMRSFEKLTVKFCDLGIDEDKLVFVAASHSNSELKYDKFTCKELRAR